jgi:hypothetical protein
MLRRGIWVAGAASHVATKSGWSAEPLEVLTADVRPLSIADGPRRGIVLDIVREALSSVGHEAHFTFLPFAEALQKTQARAGTLMAPLRLDRQGRRRAAGQCTDANAEGHRTPPLLRQRIFFWRDPA